MFYIQSNNNNDFIQLLWQQQHLEYIISNNIIDISNIDFNESLTQSSSLTFNIVEEKQSLQELSGVSSSEPRHCPNKNLIK